MVFIHSISCIQSSFGRSRGPKPTGIIAPTRGAPWVKYFLPCYRLTTSTHITNIIRFEEQHKTLSNELNLVRFTASCNYSILGANALTKSLKSFPNKIYLSYEDFGIWTPKIIAYSLTSAAMFPDRSVVPNSLPMSMLDVWSVVECHTDPTPSNRWLLIWLWA